MMFNPVYCSIKQLHLSRGIGLLALQLAILPRRRVFWSSSGEIPVDALPESSRCLVAPRSRTLANPKIDVDRDISSAFEKFDPRGILIVLCACWAKDSVQRATRHPRYTGLILARRGAFWRVVETFLAIVTPQWEINYRPMLFSRQIALMIAIARPGVDALRDTGIWCSAFRWSLILVEQVSLRGNQSFRTHHFKL